MDLPLPCSVKPLLAGLLLACAGAAEAQTTGEASPGGAHLVSINVWDGIESVSDEIQAVPGRQAFIRHRWVGPTRIPRDVSLDVLLNPNPEEPGTFELQYQLRVSVESKQDKPSLVAMGVLNLLPGRMTRPAECGRWTFDLGLDRKRRDGVTGFPRGEMSPAEAGAAGGNYRITAEASRGRARERCRQILKSGAEGNVFDGLSGEHGKLGMNLDALGALIPSGKLAGKFNLQYKLEYTPPELWTSTLRAKGEETLTLRIRRNSNEQGYRLALLVEGEPAKGPEPGRGAAAGVSRSGFGWKMDARQAAPQNPPAAVPDDARRAAVKHWDAGIIFFQRKKFELAKDEWELCKQLDPTNSDCAIGLSRIDRQSVGH